MAVLKLDRQAEIDRIILDIESQTDLAYPKDGLLDIIHAYAPGITINSASFGEFDDKVKGLIRYQDGKPEIIINNTRKNKAERTFTIAHEFGHYVLHENEHKYRVDYFDYSSDDLGSIQESEANYFAGSFLMPRSEMERLLKLTDDPIPIARYFGVSVQAVITRVEWLKKNPAYKLA
jgi:Zn-dependent peptidase ImmA (M78 family)